MENLGWEVDSAGNDRNIFIETDRKSVLEKKIPKLKLDLKDLKKKVIKKENKKLFMPKPLKGA
jgi:hypothetical protein